MYPPSNIPQYLFMPLLQIENKQTIYVLHSANPEITRPPDPKLHITPVNPLGFTRYPYQGFHRVVKAKQRQCMQIMYMYVTFV